MIIEHITKSLIILALSVSCCSSKPTSENKTTETILTHNNLKKKQQENVIPVIKPINSQEELPNSLPTKKNIEYSLKIDHSIWDNLLSKYVSNKGEVNYKGFIKDKKLFKEYLAHLSENEPTDNWTKEERLAYWMNVYNAFTIKLITDNYPVNSIKDIKDPWDKRFFKIGSKWRNLNEIEHKILRKMNDPRIHFGINCASFSCPTLHNRAFTATNVNIILDSLASAFINNPNHNTIAKSNVKLSKIFKWFSKDFKTNGSIIDYLNKYSSTVIDSNAKITYKEYNWSLNE